jgi:hypothetical protein
MIRTANDRSRLTRRKTRSNPTLPSTTPTGLSGDPTRASSVRCRPPSRTNVYQFLSPLHKCPQQRITSEHPCVTALATSRLTYSALPLKLTGPQLIKTFVLFYGTRKLNNVFTTANIYTTSCARRIQFNPSDYISFYVCIFSQGRTHNLLQYKTNLYLQNSNHCVGDTRVAKQAGSYLTILHFQSCT